MSNRQVLKKILEAHFSDSPETCCDLENLFRQWSGEGLRAPPSCSCQTLPGSGHFSFPDTLLSGLIPFLRSSWCGGAEETREHTVPFLRATLPTVRCRTAQIVWSTLLCQHDLCSGDGATSKIGSPTSSAGFDVFTMCHQHELSAWPKNWIGREWEKLWATQSNRPVPQEQLWGTRPCLQWVERENHPPTNLRNGDGGGAVLGCWLHQLAHH